jgi:hypothetical protein
MMLVEGTDGIDLLLDLSLQIHDVTIVRALRRKQRKHCPREILIKLQ